MSQNLQETVDIAAMNDAYADLISTQGRLHHQHTLLGNTQGGQGHAHILQALQQIQGQIENLQGQVENRFQQLENQFIKFQNESINRDISAMNGNVFRQDQLSNLQPLQNIFTGQPIPGFPSSSSDLTNLDGRRPSS
jgi:hypothetical protein